MHKRTLLFSQADVNAFEFIAGTNNLKKIFDIRMRFDRSDETHCFQLQIVLRLPMRRQKPPQC